MSYAPQEPQSYGPGAADRTNLPGIFLMIVGILNLLGALYFIFSGVQALGQAKDMPAQLERMTPEQKKQMEEAEKMGFSPQKWVQGFAGGFIAVGVIGVLTSLLTIVGAVKMRSLSGYPLAVAGAIFAIIPCISATGCCLLGEAIGIWALVVLMSSDVKSAFR